MYGNFSTRQHFSLAFQFIWQYFVFAVLFDCSDDSCMLKIIIFQPYTFLLSLHCPPNKCSTYSTEDRQFMFQLTQIVHFACDTMLAMKWYFMSKSFRSSLPQFISTMPWQTIQIQLQLRWREKQARIHYIHAMLAHSVPTKCAWLMNETFGHKWNEKFTPRSRSWRCEKWLQLISINSFERLELCDQWYAIWCKRWH